jgi:hypothetical protein
MYACACALKTEGDRKKKKITVVLIGESFFKKNFWRLEHIHL